MEKISKGSFWDKFTLVQKLVMEIVIAAIVLFLCNWFIYYQVNRTFLEMDSIYKSNVSLTKLSEAFDNIHHSVYEYLTVKNSNTLENYYRCEMEFRGLISGLNEKNIDYSMKLLEKNIRSMSETYLSITNEAILAKRGRNVEKYRSLYEEADRLYRYIHYYIYDLNSQQFKQNANSYGNLQHGMKYMEVMSSIILMIVMVVEVFLLILTTKDIVAPLKDLADTSYLVGQGNFHVKVPMTNAKDEIGIVTKAFNKMVDSLEDYMRKTRESMEKEQHMMEQKLLMEAHLKEAQLKYYQSQINPHFLFNSLNVGAQLAMLEDAERTCLFIEKMADFFRYNVKKSSEDATLQEEIEAVNHYIYILNVRFSGDIEYESHIDKRALSYRVPSMILQPLIENAVNHGIRNIEWKGKIWLTVEKRDQTLFISVKDNGVGMTRELIDEVMSGKREEKQGMEESTGIGLNNVKSRLELYYGTGNIMTMESEGANKGTEIILSIPVQTKEEM